MTLNEKFVKAILDVLAKDGVKYGLKGFEFVSRIICHIERTVLCGEWVFYPTVKIRRYF